MAFKADSRSRECSTVVGAGPGAKRAGPVPVVAATLVTAVLFYFGTGVATGGAPIAVLAWIAPLPVFLLAPRVSAWVAACSAFVAFFLSTINSWAFYMTSYDVPLPAGAAISVGTSLMFALATWIFRALLRRGLVFFAVVAAPAAWAGAAYLIQVANPMGLMGMLAANQGGHPLVLQIASVTGARGVAFLVLFVPGAIAALCAPGVLAGARWRAGVAFGVILVVTFTFSALRLAAADGPTQRVALIAHNHAGWGVKAGTPAGRDLAQAYAAKVAALPDGVRTVVLPEGTFSADDSTISAVVDPLRQVATAQDVDIVFGMTRHADGKKYQIALTIPAGGEPVSYLKHHDMVSPPGHELSYPPVAGARLGVAICADLNHADPSRSYGRGDAELLAVPASTEDLNGWQGSRTGLLRGVENGFATAWTARSGQLMLADGWGRVHAETTSGGQEPFSVVVADVPLGQGSTPYTALGDWFAWLCLAVTAAGLVVLSRPGSAAGRR